MTRKRAILLGGAMAACVGVGLGVLPMLPPRPGVTKAKFDRVETGMTKVEVEEIFGERSTHVSAKNNRATIIWNAIDGSAAAIDFLDDSVIGTQWHDSTIIEKIRHWLRLH